MTTSVVLHQPPFSSTSALHARHPALRRRRHESRLQPGAARYVAQAVAAFEFLLFGRAPHSITVAFHEEELVVMVCGSFSPLERRLARRDDGRHRVGAWHRDLFDATRDSLREHVRGTTGVDLRTALVDIDAETGSITKTFSTAAEIDLFLFGDGRPGLGVPVDAHLRATDTDGNGPVRD